MLRGWRTYRLENTEASLVDWLDELHSAERRGMKRGSRGVECRRVITRLERRAKALRAKLGIPEDPDA